MKLGDIVDEGLLGRAVADGYITARSEDGLIVYNYTAAAQYSGEWNEATLACRGLIADTDGRVAARPFGKFFNHDEPQVSAVPSGAPMIVTEKWDGSLGILYTALDGTRRISTRGSTRSDQAQEATRIWREKYEGLDFGPGVTPLFEIVYPTNRIVVDYRGMRDLVLLAVIDNATGADLPLERFDWPGPRADQVRFETLAELAAHMEGPRPGDDLQEGFVIRFDTGPAAPHPRIKMKWADYLELHKIVTGLTGTAVWRVAAVRAMVERAMPPKRIAARLHMDPSAVEGMLRQPDAVKALFEVVPDEFHGWIRGTLAQFEDEAAAGIELCESLVARAESESDGTDRGFAAAAQRLAADNGVQPGILFALRKGKPEAHASIWWDLKPEANSDTPAIGWPTTQSEDQSALDTLS